MRKLAIVSLGYSAAVFSAQYLIPYRIRPYFALCLAIIAAGCLLLRGDARRRVLLLCLPAAAGFLWSWGHYVLFIEPGDMLDGQTLTAKVTAVEYSEDFGSYTRLYAQIEGRDIPRVRTVIYDYDGVLPETAPGDSFTAQLRLASATTRRGEQIDDYVSRGIYLRAYLVSDEVSTERGRSLKYFPKYIAHYLTEKIDEYFPEDTRDFFKALLLGDRKDFNADRELYNATVASGLLHVVAISGMHLSFFLSFLRLFTGKTAAMRDNRHTSHNRICRDDRRRRFDYARCDHADNGTACALVPAGERLDHGPWVCAARFAYRKSRILRLRFPTA